MQFINTYNDITSCFSLEKFCFELWELYAARISEFLPNKVEADASEYNYNNEVLPVINSLILEKEKMKTASDSFDLITTDLQENFMNMYGMDLDVTVILYLGLCNGAGWATSLGDKSVVLLGIEKIVELDWQNHENMRSLIFHELGHIWHHAIAPPKQLMNTLGEKSIKQLYDEGMAMVCEQLLCGDKNYYHQNVNGWLDWCIANENKIKHEYLRRINNFESTQDFFGDWCSFKEHSDVGYFLGSRFIRFMLSQFELEDIAKFEMDKVCEQFFTFTS